MVGQTRDACIRRPTGYFPTDISLIDFRNSIEPVPRRIVDEQEHVCRYTHGLTVEISREERLPCLSFVVALYCSTILVDDEKLTQQRATSTLQRGTIVRKQHLIEILRQVKYT